MATSETLKESDGTEIYPVTDISLVNGGIHAVDIQNTTPVPAIETAMIADGAVTSAKIDWSTIVPVAITPSDYMSFDQGITVNVLAGYKIGKLVNIQYDIATSLVAGQNVVGTATNKVLKTTYGSGRVTNWNNNTQGTASIVVIPNGAVRIYTNQVGTASAGDVWFFEA